MGRKHENYICRMPKEEVLLVSGSLLRLNGAVDGQAVVISVWPNYSIEKVLFELHSHPFVRHPDHLRAYATG